MRILENFPRTFRVLASKDYCSINFSHSLITARKLFSLDLTSFEL